MCLLAGLLLVLVRSDIAIFSGKADAYCVGEWLINYGGGFVRRGLSGTIILGISAISGVRPRLVLFAILFGSYLAIFLAAAVALVRSRRPTILELVLTLSPFATLYPLIHNVAGQRKEVLMLAVMSIAYLRGLVPLRSTASYITWSVTLAALVAINDATIFFLPLFVFYLVVLAERDSTMKIRVSQLLALAVPAGAVFGAGYLLSHHVDIRAICATTERYEKGLWCLESPPGQFPVAVSWLKASVWDGLHAVLARYTLASGFLVIAAGLVGMLPVAIALAHDVAPLRRVLRALPAPELYLAICFVSFAAIFVVANDWTRWFYVLTSLLTLSHFACREYEAQP